MTVNHVSDSHHPLLKFKDRKTFAPDYHYSEWLAFMTNLGPEDFQWHAKWLRVREARFMCGLTGPVPLLGITGVTEYYPTRVARQF